MQSYSYLMHKRVAKFYFEQFFKWYFTILPILQIAAFWNQ